MPRAQRILREPKAPFITMRKTPRKFDRRPRPSTRRVRTIAEIRNTYGLSDWELGDIYNEHYGTMLPSPIPDKLALLALNAVRKAREPAAA